MSLSFAELAQPSTKDQIATTILSVLTLAGFPVTSWQPGSVPLTLIEGFATATEEAWFTIAKLTRAGIILAGYSQGANLDLAAQSQYDEERKPAASTVTLVRITDAGGGPHTIAVGVLIVGTSNGLQYRCSALPSGATLALNGILDVEVTAVEPAAKYNVSLHTINTMVTTLPTVTVDNIVAVEVFGADVESDDSYAARMPLKWATLSTGSPDAAYEFWALTQGIGVTRVHVDDLNPDGPNTIRVWIDSAFTTVVQDYIQQSDGSGKAAAGSKVLVVSAIPVTIVLPLSIVVRAGTRATASAAILANLTTLSNTIQIGGNVLETDIIKAIRIVPDSVDVSFSGTWVGTPNIALAAGHIPTFDASGITFTEAT